MGLKSASNDFNRPVQWIGGKEDAGNKISFARNCSQYSLYKKCIFKHMTLNIGDFVLVQNDCSTNDVAKILHLYEIEDEYYAHEHCRAIVQWYSRPIDLPRKILQNEDADYILDFDCEVIQDNRFGNDISIDSINDLCHLIEISPNKIPTNEIAMARQKNLKVRQQRLPCVACRFRLEGGKNAFLVPVNAPPQPDKKANPARHPSIAQRRVSMCGPVEEKTPTKTPRRKSALAPRNWKISPKHETPGDKRKSTNKSKVSPIKLIVDRLTPEDILLIMNEDDSDFENGTPNKRSKRPTKNAKKNLDQQMNETLNDSDLLNYSIIQDVGEGETKIKLRISETQRKTPSRRKPIHSSTQTLARKRTTPQTPEVEICVTPKKSRRASISAAIDNLSTTPRRSILKTPSSQLLGQQHDTPRRSVCLPKVVEEEAPGEPKTPKRRGRPSSVRKNEVDEPKTAKTPKSTTTTPSAKMRLIRSGALTPTIHSRDVAIRKSTTDLQVARERLHVSAVPKSLPCRETEYQDIYSFLEGKIVDECGGCMYVSGVPGTGKTATVTEVIKALKRAADDEEIPEFEFVDINGMRLSEPRQAYVHIYRQLTGKTVHWEQAYTMLEKRFTTPSPRRIQTVLLVDELDILCNRRQDVVYNLLNWPTLTAARLVIITIANTMDLPERLLIGKITSRLGLTRLTFAPYTFKQLQEIVMARLAGIESFKGEAVQLVARKVAAVSGDARRALDICRRATEIAEGEDRKAVVSMGHVQKALGEMISSAKVQAIRSSSKMEQLFLEAVTNEVARTGVEETTLLGVYAQLEALAGINDVGVPNISRTLALCSKLSASRLLICEHSRQDLYMKILLNISSDDVHYALKLANEAV